MRAERESDNTDVIDDIKGGDPTGTETNPRDDGGSQQPPRDGTDGGGNNIKDGDPTGTDTNPRDDGGSQQPPRDGTDGGGNNIKDGDPTGTDTNPRDDGGSQQPPSDGTDSGGNNGGNNGNNGNSGNNGNNNGNSGNSVNNGNNGNNNGNSGNSVNNGNNGNSNGNSNANNNGENGNSNGNSNANNNGENGNNNGNSNANNNGENNANNANNNGNNRNTRNNNNNNDGVTLSNNPNPSGHNPPDNVTSHYVYGHEHDDPEHSSGNGWLVWIYYPHNYVDRGHPRGLGDDPIDPQTGPGTVENQYGFTLNVSGGKITQFVQTSGDCTDTDNDYRDDNDDTPCSSTGSDYSAQIYIKEDNPKDEGLSETQKSNKKITITIRWTHGMYAPQSQTFNIMRDVSMKNWDEQGYDPEHTNQDRWE